MKDLIVIDAQLENGISALIEEARKSVVNTINTTMVYTYYEIGRLIVEEEQDGENKAKYGEQKLHTLACSLSARYGKGFSYVNLTNMRKFYLCYREKFQTLSKEFKFTLSWSHYLKLMRINRAEVRAFYEIESAKNNWSLRELERQFNSALYERLVLSRDKDKVQKLISANIQ